MPSYYVYFLSSLPVLWLGAKPPFSFDEFIEKAKGLIPEKDLQIISSIPNVMENPFHSGGGKPIPPPEWNGWTEFDTALRNEFVKIRATRKKIDAAKYIKENNYWDPSISRVAITAYRNPSVLEGEKFLDKERWNFLDELSLGHYFDIDALVIYAIKLLIVIKQNNIETSDKARFLEAALS